MPSKLSVLAVLSLTIGCASGGSGTDTAPVPVYLRASDVPCEYQVVGRVNGFISVTSTQQYISERDRVLGRQGARAGADAVLIPPTQQEPDRDNVGIPFRRVGGVPQASDLNVAGEAIRFTGERCAGAP